ncbi:MAG: hypothetical protein B0W54_12555 [Cellvibrio sp. 79]|nr:MAG: hypothetical protein B0W54_12555 [Cellvibrio sp. 79]
MLNIAQHQLKITTGGYEVIASGIVHLTESELKFYIGGLTIKYRFNSDNEGERFEAEIINNELIIKLFNFSNPLGQGRIDPVELGIINGRKLFATFWVDTPDLMSNHRQFSYTFLLAEQ